MPARVSRLATASNIDVAEAAKLVGFSGELTGFSELAFLPSGHGPAKFGDCLHHTNSKLWVVISGFGILHSCKFYPNKVRAERMAFHRIYPGCVVSVAPNVLYSFTFDEPITLYGSPNDQSDAITHVLGQFAPEWRAEMYLQAMVEYSGGTVESRESIKRFSFPGGKTVILDSAQMTITCNNESFSFNNENLSLGLAHVREYLGI
ncbi:MAG TPA: hypothetical protein VFT87_05260 [Candidatus Saccharimonadales bacterium]|nr:hypothetical protein [Candidatus Saccharimonadales bacterium]